MTESQYFDGQETRAPEARETDLFAALRDQIDHAKANAPYFVSALADIDAAAVTNRQALAKLPVLRKAR